MSSGIDKSGIEDRVSENMELDHFVKSALPLLKGPGRKPGIRVQETFGKVLLSPELSQQALQSLDHVDFLAQAAVLK